jgi:hypothetical protein
MSFARYHSHGSIVLVTVAATSGATFRMELPPEAATGDPYTADTVIAERETHGQRSDLDCG